MKPILFSIAGYPVYAYMSLILLGFMVAVAGLSVSLRKQGIKVADTFYLGILCFLLGMAGAKLFSIMFHPAKFWGYYEQYGLWALVSRAGFSFHGAVAGGLLAIYLFSREISPNPSLLKRGISEVPPLEKGDRGGFLWLCDEVAPFGALTYAVGRIGCFFAGCCWGIKSDAPFAVVFPPGPYHHDFSAHLPVQLIDSFLNLLLFGYLLSVLPRKRFQGHTFAIYLIAYSCIRILMDYLRFGESAQVLWGVISQAQVGSLILIVLSLGFIKWRSNRKFFVVSSPLSVN